MTLDHDLVSDDLFGLAGTFPRPGWVVLDAARDRRFTGELLFETLPQVSVHLDRGRVYLAERATDPSLGARLVDAGALSATQLEHGSMRIGGDEHLGRLFERVPSVDRHTVLITTELMTEECVGWLAHQRIDDVRVLPYRRHPSGIHRWERAPAWEVLAPGDPLPAPDPTAEPVELTAPEPLFVPEGLLTDDMIQWDEPSWLDERTFDVAARAEEVPPAAPRPERAVVDSPPPSPSPLPPPPAPATGPIGDWVDRLESDGLPEPGSDPLASPAELPQVPVEPVDRFEVIWPSGEVDEQFGSTNIADVGDRHPDLDRVGPTARVVRAPSPEAPADTIPTAADGSSEVTDESPDEVTDEVVLAVRRAVASIETSAAAGRHRLADDALDPTPSRGVALPTRVVARTEPADVSPGVARPPTRSVFDEVPVDGGAPPTWPPAPPAVAESKERRVAPEVPETQREPAAEPERTSALRRLIGSIIRR